MSRMNDAQTIFTLFFAISWGIQSNVLPRWKPFHYALCWPAKIRPMTEPVEFYVHWHPAFYRLIASWLLLNILPWFLFAVVLFALGRCTAQVDDWRSWSPFWLVVRAVLPGLIPFGCYRLWLSLMHASPTCFFAKTEHRVPRPFRKTKRECSPVEPSARSLGLMVPGRRIPGIVGNAVAGSIYLLIGMLVAFYS
jgi:hypothetical protein